MGSLLEKIFGVKEEVIEKFNYVKDELIDYWIERRGLRCYYCREVTDNNFRCKWCHEMVCIDCTFTMALICDSCEENTRVIRSLGINPKPKYNKYEHNRK